MLRETEETFDKHNRAIFDEVYERFGVAPGEFRRLGAFESFVFEYSHNGADRILRITPGCHRSVDQIRGELEWINYLADSGVSVIRALPSIGGSIIEAIEIDGAEPAAETLYSAVSFTRAPGAKPGKADWNAELFRAWGRIIGQMHALTKAYEPSCPAVRRHLWYEDEDLRGRHHIPSSQETVLERYDSLIAYLKALPTDRNSFGLIHEDMHHGNFFVDNGRVTVFDFGDCQYHWFAADIAIPLFYVMRNKVLNDGSTEFADHFFSCLMEGYKQENTIGIEWLEQIPYFLKLREMILYIVIRAEDIADSDDWCRDYMDGRRERIENDVPVIDLDFAKYA